MVTGGIKWKRGEKNKIKHLCSNVWHNVYILSEQVRQDVIYLYLSLLQFNRMLL